MSNKRNKTMIFVSVALILVSSFGCFLSDIASDLYRDDLVKINCHIFSKLYWNASGGIISRSRFSIDTYSSYKEVVDWYKKRGWGCDGSCEYFRDIDFGPISFSIFKRLSPPHDDDVSNIYTLFEEYSISFYPVSHYWLD